MCNVVVKLRSTSLAQVKIGHLNFLRSVYFGIIKEIRGSSGRDRTLRYRIGRTSGVRSQRRKQGSGTLIFLAFMVICFLFAIALFNWFTQFATRSNRIFNQGAIARMLAESAINEANLLMAQEINKFPNSPDPKWAAYFKDPLSPSEEKIEVPKTNEVAVKPIADGGFGLTKRMLGGSDIVVEVKRLNERPITDVDFRGMILLECTVNVGSYGRVVTRAFEYCRFKVIPPGHLGNYSFVALNWSYMQDRWLAYTTMLLKHMIVRQIVVNTTNAAMDAKSKIATDGKAYCTKVIDAIPGFVGKNNTKDENDVIKFLGGQLDQYHEDMKGAKAEGRPNAKPSFALPYLGAMKNLSTGNLDQVKQEASGLKLLPNKLDDFKFRPDKFASLKQKADEIANTIKGSSMQDIGSKINPAVDSFLDQEKQHWKTDVNGRGIASPIYIAADGGDPRCTEVKHSYLQFHVPELPTGPANSSGSLNIGNSGGQNIELPQFSVPPGDRQITPSKNGAAYFFFDPAEIGTDMNLMKKFEDRRGEKDPNKDISADEAKSTFNKSGNAFAEDLSKFQDFKGKWEKGTDDFEKVLTGDQNGTFNDDPAQNSGQLPGQAKFLHLSSIKEHTPSSPGGQDFPISKLKSSLFISDKFNRARACYYFPDPGSFAAYSVTQMTSGKKAAGGKGPFKLAGVYFVENGGAGSKALALPEKYSGMGVIASNGPIELKQGIAKSNPQDCGNLILISEKHIQLGGQTIDASVISKDTLKTDGSSTPTINGNLIVKDTLDGQQGQSIANNNSTVNATNYFDANNNKLPPFTIKYDKELADYSDKYQLMVICPYRVAQNCKRQTFW